MEDKRRSSGFSLNPKEMLVGAQMLFVAFGALVLVPLLTGFNPNVALFTAGAGTLLFQLVTRRKVPVFLASSFAFIAPMIYGVQTWGIPATLCGLAGAGVFYLFLSLLVKLRGSGFVSRIFPPIVTGPVIMTIGLILAPVAVHMAMGRTGDGSAVLVPQGQAMILSGVALLVTVLASLFGRGLIRLVPILCGLVAGYLVALTMGLVDFTPISQAAWLVVPAFVLPSWSWEAIFFMLPVAIAPAIEHFGDVLAISSVTGKNYLEDPGIHRTLLGDGLATSLAALLGGPPNTTYSEVTGAVALTRMFNPVVMTWAAVTAIVLAFVGKVGAVLQTVPVPVMGGIMILLFGAIAVVGLNTLVRAGEDLMAPRNLAIVALTIVSGMGGMKIEIGQFALQGIGLAGILAVLLNLLLPKGTRQNTPGSAGSVAVPVDGAVE